MASIPMSLKKLEMPGNFIRRHIGSNGQQIQQILDELQLDSLDDVITKAIPESILEKEPLKLTQMISEQAVIKHLRKIRDRNKVILL